MRSWVHLYYFFPTPYSLLPLNQLVRDAKTHLKHQYNWYKTANKAKWNNLTEVQAVYPQTEAVGNLTVFNIKGNKYRLIVDLVYSDQIIYIKYILTHAEYDKDEWKNDPYF
ncbi:MAG: type II toxin-antitoxin system HigB family toxin [Desmonostoc vinosum HA7617-LM4]|nr:type II toxin-antitoxin system HigB family toxin [Desmonostoc vinosum HA7617-LM4]